ncbi:uncharacterized protein LOC128717489 [Anopheles marshallii]|uniref:uncharacterized protein LOC128717489 n=1 Tax=Anopheles marshallii TaxID=1521116 RepID=UPI00237ABB0C|nr:uncharacterized protein LOC128717489 [Anopheles marshallii]
MYDGVLRLTLPDGVETVGFADDLVVLAAGTTPQEAATLAEEAISLISSWMEAHHLELAPAKTELVMISTMRRANSRHPVTINGVERMPKESIKYLGVILQDHMVRGNRRKLTRVQNLYVRPVARTFISVRYEVATVLAGVVPICLQVKEDARCYRKQQETGTSLKELHVLERQATLAEWQTMWDELEPTSRYTRWTHRVVPDIGLWKARRHDDMPFYLAQVLSGHGFFHEYLHSRHLAPSAECRRCPGVPESAEHAFFQCPRFADVRQGLLGEDSEFPATADTFQALLLSSRERWSDACVAAKIITTTLQQEWYIERATSANDGMVAAVQRLDAAHEAAVAARNERRNEARRALTRERQAARGAPPPAVHPDGRLLSSEELAERDAHRLRTRDNVRRHRARHRLANAEAPDCLDYLWALFGVEAFQEEDEPSGH